MTDDIWYVETLMKLTKIIFSQSYNYPAMCSHLADKHVERK